MLGRTYSLGYEPDLRDALIDRPRRTVLNPAWRWAIWYPLRRSGKFAQLPDQEQRTILAEHGAIGMAFGAADYAHDVRLACHGLDRDDNDFVIGLIGKELFPAVGGRASHAEDAADLAVPRPARTVLRRAGRRVAESSVDKRDPLTCPCPLRPFGRHASRACRHSALGGYHLGLVSVGPRSREDRACRDRRRHHVYGQCLGIQR